jgi:hypothetical protein
MDVCKWMVFQAACDFAKLNEFGCNAIQWAAQASNLEMCRWLAALGLDLTIINNNGHSALHKAASKGQARVCEWLLNEECLGLEALQPDSDGNTPGLMARLEGHTALADALDAAAEVLALEDANPKHNGVHTPASASMARTGSGKGDLNLRSTCDGTAKPDGVLQSTLIRTDSETQRSICNGDEKLGGVLPQQCIRKTGVGQAVGLPPFRMFCQILESSAERQVAAGDIPHHGRDTKAAVSAAAAGDIPHHGRDTQAAVSAAAAVSRAEVSGTIHGWQMKATETNSGKQWKAHGSARPSIMKGSSESYQAACVRQARLEQILVR